MSRSRSEAERETNVEELIFGSEQLTSIDEVIESTD
jgi:hypothetical protein